MVYRSLWIQSQYSIDSRVLAFTQETNQLLKTQLQTGPSSSKVGRTPIRRWEPVQNFHTTQVGTLCI